MFVDEAREALNPRPGPVPGWGCRGLGRHSSRRRFSQSAGATLKPVLERSCWPRPSPDQSGAGYSPLRRPTLSKDFTQRPRLHFSQPDVAASSVPSSWWHQAAVHLPGCHCPALGGPPSECAAWPWMNTPGTPLLPGVLPLYGSLHSGTLPRVLAAWASRTLAHCPGSPALHHHPHVLSRQQPAGTKASVPQEYCPMRKALENTASLSFLL